MERLSAGSAARLALARAGLLRPAWTDLPARVGSRASASSVHEAALAHIRRPGYLQLDTVAVAGARSHGIVLASRLEGFRANDAEDLLAPGSELFEYWGHEASWMPMELYPAFAFRREDFAVHPWWGDLLKEHRETTRAIVARIRAEGPLRSADLEGASKGGFWNLKLSKKLVLSLWSSGELAIRERRAFLRTYDLRERVIPKRVRGRPLALTDSLRALLLRALDGHGWATTGTLAATWRLRNLRAEITTALEQLREADQVRPCTLETEGGERVRGWIRPRDLELAARLRRARPRRDRGVLLSPFDPVLWDRKRVARLFNFQMLLEIFKPKAQRVYGYYCMPVLAGDRLIARVDLKADRKRGSLELRALHYEPPGRGRRGAPEQRAAVEHALARYAASVELRPPPRA